MKQDKYLITENTQLTPTTWRMKLRGDVSAVTAPGQFINIRLDGHFLRRPISVNDVEKCEECGSEGSYGLITIIYKVLGRGTEEMTYLKPGAELDILTGLGNGYCMEEAGDMPLLIGGGVGIPPLYLLARILTGDAALLNSGDPSAGAGEKAEHGTNDVIGERKVTVILGFNTAEEMYYVEEFEKLGCRVVVATADGSCGRKGFVTDAFRELVSECGSPCLEEAGFGDEGGGAEFCRYTHFYTCGPEPMLKAVYREVYEGAGISGQMSFEERMGCGFGACMGCSCRTVTGYKRICKDGPVLRTEEIIW